MITLEAFPNATDAFLDTSVGYYRTLKKIAVSAFEKLLNFLLSEVYR